MNFGQTLLALRRKRNVTQEELAAVLGVTAAAVSKWENNYTLPDILMLCAIADQFQVTTDYLLGRDKQDRVAAIAADTAELGQKITQIAKKYGIITQGIYSSFEAAAAAAAQHDEICMLLISLNGPTGEERYRSAPDRIQIIESCGPDQLQVLAGFEMFLRSAN